MTSVEEVASKDMSRGDGSQECVQGRWLPMTSVKEMDSKNKSRGNGF